MSEVRSVSIGEIKPYWNNPRIITDISAVVRSIEAFGFRNPIIVDRNMTIITGHVRHMAASALGMSEVPVIIAEDMTEEQARAYRLADNKTGELATWDREKLDEELEALAEEDLTVFGFEPEPEEDEDPGADLDAEDFGTDFALPDMDEGPEYHTMTFVLSVPQADIVRDALDRAGAEAGNEKGDQLTEICLKWLEQKTAS